MLRLGCRAPADREKYRRCHEIGCIIDATVSSADHLAPETLLRPKVAWSVDFLLLRNACLRMASSSSDIW